MSIPNSLQNAPGTWTGTNHLYLPGEATRITPSTATVSTTAQGKFLTLAYTWTFDDTPQDGLLLIGESTDQPAISAVWVDSWHMGHKMMHCQGTVETDGAIDLKGTYTVENYPPWGWRTMVRSTPETLEIRMFNISPEGEEELAVEMLFAPQAG